MDEIQLFSRATAHSDRIAIRADGTSFSYQNLLDASERVAAKLLFYSHGVDLQEARVAYMVKPSFEYAVVQWGIWRGGGVAVPLALSYPAAELEYAISEADCSLVVCQAEFAENLRPIVDRTGGYLIIYEEIVPPPIVVLPIVTAERRAMILFTSGTTSKPKGVVTTHRNLEAQIKALIEAWQWTPDDHVLNVLPLHHTHGIVNMLCCALWSGACCEFIPFDPEAVWNKFAEGKLSLFMAVPTIYHRLMGYWEKSDPNKKAAQSQSCKNFRLMVSGSAALPVPVLEKWEVISGQRLLERYGMTEIGMALSNPYEGERRAGFVGKPLPGVQVELLSEEGSFVRQERETGEIVVRGANVFLEYWNRPDATWESFTEDGWFKTGDIASLEEGYFRIHGRSSVDIIKSGGYKISALQIEEVLLVHPSIAEAAVVGLPEDDLGERVAAALVMAEGHHLNEVSLREWASEKLAPYKLPRTWLAVAEMPRNALGKVVKPKVKELFVTNTTED